MISERYFDHGELPCRTLGDIFGGSEGEQIRAVVQLFVCRYFCGYILHTVFLARAAARSSRMSTHAAYAASSKLMPLYFSCL